MEHKMVSFEDFQKLDIRAGEIIWAEPLEKAKKPAFALKIDFGKQVGTKQSSAQITECYTAQELIGKQVLGVVNFSPKRVAGFLSEVLVLGIYAKQGVVLISPDQRVNNGDKLG